MKYIPNVIQKLAFGAARKSPRFARSQRRPYWPIRASCDRPNPGFLARSTSRLLNDVGYRTVTTLLTLWVFAADASTTGLPLSEVAGEPSTLVAGYVNAITGSYTEQAADIMTLGAESLSFQRSYNSSDWSGGYLSDSWGHNFQYWAVVEGDLTGRLRINFPHLSGGTTVFEGNKKARSSPYGPCFPRETCVCTLNRPEMEVGLTNCGGGEISGRTHLKNKTVQLTPDASGYVTAGDGSISVWTPQEKQHEKLLPCPLLLRSEKKPSGNNRFFNYDNERRLSRIMTVNSLGKLLNWIDFEFTKDRRLILRSSEGKTVQYSVNRFKGSEKQPDRYRLSEVTSSDRPTICYQYTDYKRCHEQMIRRSGPDGRHLEVGYFSSNKGTPPSIVGHVAELRAPVGTDATPISTHTFNYQTDYTAVLDAHRHQSTYHHANKRLTQITRFTGNTEATYSPYSSERFYWGDQNSVYRSDLIGKALLDANGVVRSCRLLNYDQRHNVVDETLCGNLSGHSTILPALDQAGILSYNGCERVTTRFSYSDDGFNLLLSEQEENGRTTRYSYKPGTDLLTSKLVGDGNLIVSREFHHYNEDGVRVRSVSDDGCGFEEGDLTGVAVRVIDVIEPRLEAPGVGLPIRAEKRYLDPESGIERLLSRVVNHYDSELQIIQQDHFDADEQLRYSLNWEYDRMGNVISQTNAVGQITTRKFDDNGNKIFEKEPHNAFSKTYLFDFANRCICEEQVYPDGSRRTHTAKYDTLGHKVAEVDFMGHETRYTFDELGRVIQVQLPESEDASGAFRLISTYQEYDIAGNIVAFTDGNGHRKITRYNMCGKPAEICYPDGTSERKIYNRDGTVKSERAVNGLETVYTYDILGNVIRKDHLSPDGTLLSTTSATFKGSRVLSETDANGNMTSYTYDGAGRLTGIFKHDSHTHYKYDALGNRYITEDWSDVSDMQCRVTRTTRDLFERIVEERIENAQGDLLKLTRYDYDSYGNRIAVHQATGTELGTAITYTVYDADNRAIRHTDPLGNATVIEHDDALCNARGQRVSQTRTTDPLGNQTWVTKNAMGRVMEELRKDLWGKVTAKRTHRHDANGNVIETVETVIVDGEATREVIAHFAYDSMNRNISTIEAVGTAEERVTHQSYNSYGQQEALLLPDGLILHFVYDAAGRLKQYHSSDKTVDYSYSYDANGNVVQVDDRKEGNVTRRSYDGSNRIFSETLGNGLHLQYQYDGFGRVRQLTLPDQSGIRYTYNPLTMQTVERIDSQGQQRYAHHYRDYDLTGHARRTILAGNAGEVFYATDLMGRALSMASARVSETIAPGDYDAVGNLLHRAIKDPYGASECRYDYDSLYQITQETGVAKHSYRYDSLNNRLAKDSDSYQVNALNELTQAGLTHYHYNLRGCRISEDGGGRQVSYRYDALNRLVEVETPHQTIKYSYDSFNRRLSTTTTTTGWLSNDVGQKRFLYVGQDEIGAADENDRLTELRLLGTGHGAEIGATVAIELADKVYASLANSSGHIIALINASDGTFAEGYRYSAFGEVVQFNDFWWPFKAHRTGNPWQFSSKRIDPETGFVAFGRRYYDSALGRWVTPDPLGFKAGPNLYAYVMNNPLTHFDLYGLLGMSCRGRNLDAMASYRPIRGAERAAMGRQMLGGLFSWAGCLPGRAVEAIGRDIVPIPIAHEVIEGVGRVMQLRPFFGCPHCQEHRSNTYSVGREQLAPDRVMTLGNGMKNCLYDTQINAANLSAENENSCVYNCYSATNGFISDTCESLSLMLGHNSEAVYNTARTWKNELAQMDANGYPEGRIRHLAHSQGGQIAWAARKFMTPEELKRIDVETYGSAKIIPRGVFGSAVNYISKWDAVPCIASPVDYFRARSGHMDNVIFLEGHGIPLCDHGWDGETYKEARQYQNRKYKAEIRA